MKNESNGSPLASRIRIAWALVAISTVLSCSKSSDVGGDLAHGNLAVVRVGISQVLFEDVGNIGSLASTGGSPGRSLSLSRRSIVDLDEDYYMVEELTADTVPPVSATVAKISATWPATRAAVESGVAPPGIRYKTVVYDDAGTYVTQKDYVHGQEASTDTLQLDGDRDYTFIVYSVNSTSVLPDVVFSDPNNMTLATSTVSVAGNQDFMYFRRDMTISATAQHYLEVVLKHRFSQIITAVDATATGYNMTARLRPTTPVRSSPWATRASRAQGIQFSSELSLVRGSYGDQQPDDHQRGNEQRYLVYDRIHHRGPAHADEHHLVHGPQHRAGGKVQPEAEHRPHG